MLLCICQERNVSCLCSALQEAGIQAEPWVLALLLLLGRDVVAVNWAGGVTLAWNACRFSSAVAFWSIERYSRRGETINQATHEGSPDAAFGIVLWDPIQKKC